MKPPGWPAPFRTPTTYAAHQYATNYHHGRGESEHLHG